MNTTTRSLLAAASVLCFSTLVACTQTTTTEEDPAPSGDDSAASGDDSTPPAPAADAGKSDASKDSGSKSDAGTPPPPPPPAPMCSIVGTWDGTGPSNGTCNFPGEWLHWTLQLNGYGKQSWQDGSGFVETFSFGAGGSLIFNSTNIDIYCGAGTAQYQVAFDASCNSYKLTKISDTCVSRSACLDGMVLTLEK